MPRRRLLALLAVGWLLTGCNPFDSATPMMNEYVERVARVLDLEPVYSDVPDASHLPRRRNRQLDMPELDMNMLDFLSLYGCELQYVIGEKNSVMGKVMQPLNRLRYELRFIDAAQDCLPEIEDEGVRASLQEAVASKKQSLPIALWNATWGVKEIETLFTLTKGDYPVAPEGNPVASLSNDARQLNETVAQLLAGDLSPSLDYVGGVQQRWLTEHRAGQLINSARLLVVRLEDASALLKQRIDGRPLCFKGKPNNQSDIVRSMFFRVYIEKIQPYMSEVQRAETQLLEPLSRLASMQFPVMPPQFRQWYNYYLNTGGSDSLWGELDAAMAEHTRLWQTLLEQCGLRPQA